MTPANQPIRRTMIPIVPGCWQPEVRNFASSFSINKWYWDLTFFPFFPFLFLLPSVQLVFWYQWHRWPPRRASCAIAPEDNTTSDLSVPRPSHHASSSNGGETHRFKAHSDRRTPKSPTLAIMLPRIHRERIRCFRTLSLGLWVLLLLRVQRLLFRVGCFFLC